MEWCLVSQDPPVSVVWFAFECCDVLIRFIFNIYYPLYSGNATGNITLATILLDVLPFLLFFVFVFILFRNLQLNSFGFGGYWN